MGKWVPSAREKRFPTPRTVWCIEGDRMAHFDHMPFERGERGFHATRIGQIASPALASNAMRRVFFSPQPGANEPLRRTVTSSNASREEPCSSDSERLVS